MEELKNAFMEVINKKNEAKNKAKNELEEWLKKRKALADNMVEKLSFLTELGFKLEIRRYYEDCSRFHFNYEVAITKPNGDHGANIYPCEGEYVASSYQVAKEGENPMSFLGITFFETWDELARGIAYALC